MTCEEMLLNFLSRNIFIYVPAYCKILNIIVESSLALHGLKGAEQCLMESLETETLSGGVT
jgi:hypothetical protein